MRIYSISNPGLFFSTFQTHSTFLQFLSFIQPKSFFSIDREEELRSVSEVTNTRVALFSFMSLGVCIAVSALQVWHLKRYFQKKKLIQILVIKLLFLAERNFATLFFSCTQKRQLYYHEQSKVCFLLAVNLIFNFFILESLSWMFVLILFLTDRD